MDLHYRASNDGTCLPMPPTFPRACTPPMVRAIPRTDSRTLQLLFVGHDPRFAAHVKSLFEKQRDLGLEAEWTECLDAATRRIRKDQVDAVILDICLPELLGIESFRVLHDVAPDLPVIIVGDLDNEAAACQLIREGAQDYLPKRSLNLQRLSRSIRFAVERSKLKPRAAKRELRSSAGQLTPGEPLALLHTSLGDLNQPLPQSLQEPSGPVPKNPDWLETLGYALESIEETGRKIQNNNQRSRVSSCGEEGLDSARVSLPSLSRKTRILFVEPSDKDYQKLRACLKWHKHIRLIRSTTIHSALDLVSRHAIDLVCLDYSLPDGDAHDFLAKISDSGLDVPVVIITAHRDPMAAAQLIQAGAYDYLQKQKLSQSPLFRVILNALEKARFRKQLKEAHRKIIEMSILDELTGLFNRRYFMETLEKETARSCRYGSPLVMCMVDVDEFKRVNDTFGHQAGDIVLRELGNILRGSIRMSDVACRYGGEEFALLLPNTDLREAKAMGERLRHTLETRSFQWNGTAFKVTASLGLAQLNQGAKFSSMELVEKADKALYKAKRDGKNRVVADVGGNGTVSA